jgi:hypothetical protein
MVDVAAVVDAEVIGELRVKPVPFAITMFPPVVEAAYT